MEHRKATCLCLHSNVAAASRSYFPRTCASEGLPRDAELRAPRGTGRGTRGGDKPHAPATPQPRSVSALLEPPTEESLI